MNQSMHTLKQMSLAALILLCAAGSVRATNQRTDELELDGVSSQITEDPLSEKVASVFSEPGLQGKLYIPEPRRCTASYRGYKSNWRVVQDKLTLIRVVADPCSSQPKDLDLKPIAEGKSTPLLASWYTGVIWVGRGQPKMSPVYGSAYEKYVVLVIQRGQVLSRTSVDGPR